MYSTVLVATDGSDGAASAADHAIDLAETHGADLHTLYVVDRTYPAMAEFDAVVEGQEREGEAALEAVEAAAVEHDVAVEKVLRRGKPYEEILGYAAHNDVDVVCLGVTGRSAMDRLVNAGSTTQRVIRHTHLPVVAVPPAGREPLV